VRYSASLPVGATSDPVAFNGSDETFSFDPRNHREHSGYGVIEGVSCVGHTCYGQADNIYTVSLPFFGRNQWTTVDAYPHGSDFQGQRNTTQPSCAIRGGYSAYALCLTQNTSTFSQYNATYNMPDVSALCPLTAVTSEVGATEMAGVRRRLSSTTGGATAPWATSHVREELQSRYNDFVHNSIALDVVRGSGDGDPAASLSYGNFRLDSQGAGSTRSLAVTAEDSSTSVGISITEFGAMYDVVTVTLYAEVPYVISVSVVSFFSCFMFLVFALAVLVGRWDYDDQWKVRRYLHRDMLRKGKDASEPLFRHINAIVDSVGIKDSAGEDYCGDSDEEEIEDWYEKQAELKANSSFLCDGEDVLASENDIAGSDADGDSRGAPLSPLTIRLHDEEKEEEVAYRAELPEQMTGTAHMNIVADLEIEEDEAAEDARRQELLALEWELDSDGGGTDADSAAEDNVDILNENKKIKDELGAVDHSLVMTGGDHFASYYSVKVESFLRQALHLTGSVYQVCLLRS
jgi:hypothetical protein